MNDNNFSIGVEVEIIKGIPEKQINQFEDRVVYFTAIGTREYTKGRRAYPYLTGDLERAEVASPVTGSNKEYNLLAGTNYAKYVYRMKNPHWTNKSTLPQWYHTAFRTRGKSIVMEAVSHSLKEIKK